MDGNEGESPTLLISQFVWLNTEMLHMLLSAILCKNRTIYPRHTPEERLSILSGAPKIKLDTTPGNPANCSF